METDYLNLVDRFRKSAQQYADRTAFIFNNKELTFNQLDVLSDRLAADLQARGIQKGDRIGLYCINSDFYAIAFLGIIKSGAAVAPVNLLLNPKEISYNLNDCGAKGLIYFEAFSEAVQAIKPTLTDLAWTMRIGQEPVDGEIMWKDALTNDNPTPEITLDTAEDLAVILYTSGTTGHPKGAMLTHRNLSSNCTSVHEALKMTDHPEKILVVLPMFHAFAAMAGMLLPLMYGHTIVPLPKFDPHQVAEIIEAEQISFFFAVPSMYTLFLRLPEEFDAKFKTLQWCVSGGAAMPVEVMDQFESRFGVAIHEGDGPTECSPVTCINPIGGKRKPGTVGLEVPNVRMKILDEQGDELPNGTIGEICVKGPNVMKGYWNNPEETKASFFDDWFRTGDLGTKDDEGYFAILDRKKDMIIVNGMNVYPRVIEEVLYQHPAIHEVAVIGEPHKMHGEIPLAYVALQEGTELDGPGVKAYCRDNLGRHEVPKKVFFMDALPKNAAGKIMKRELRKDGEIERGIDNR